LPVPSTEQAELLVSASKASLRENHADITRLGHCSEVVNIQIFHPLRRLIGSNSSYAGSGDPEQVAGWKIRVKEHRTAFPRHASNIARQSLHKLDFLFR